MNLIKATIATAAVITCCLGNDYPARAESIKHQFKESGDGWRGRPWMGVVVMQDGNTFSPRRTEQTSAFSAVIGSWADYPATAVRACKAAADSFDTSDCIVASGPSITLPEDASKDDYSFEFKYQYGDTVRTGSFSF